MDTLTSQLSALAADTSTIEGQLPSAFYGSNASTPTQTTGGLSPLQLALATKLTTGIPAFGVNEVMLKELRKFSDSGIVGVGSVRPDVVGIALVSIGDDIYLYRDAMDCGPDEKDRTEQVYLGTRANVAFGTFAHYGPKVAGGTLSDGSSVSSSSTSTN